MPPLQKVISLLKTFLGVINEFNTFIILTVIPGLAMPVRASRGQRERPAAAALRRQKS